MRGETLDAALLDLLTSSWTAQPDKPHETPESTLRALYHAAAGNPVSVHKASALPLPDLDQHARTRLKSLVEKRIAGVPLAHLTGREHFLGIELLAGPQALIPRAETEILGRAALPLATQLADVLSPVVVLDLCTGCGNLALAIAAHEPRARVFGSDLSADAIELARKNAQHLGLEARVEFRESDMFNAFESAEFLGKVDLITCNPPYISSAKVGTMHPEISNHEPRLAFDGGALGVAILGKLIREAPRFLKPGSFLCFETGLGQGNPMTRLMGNAKEYNNIQTHPDAMGNVRALTAQKIRG
jgi:release factor glutamine methyltransferase